MSQIEDMVRAHIAAALPQAQLAEIARQVIDARIAIQVDRVDGNEGARRLSLPNKRAFWAWVKRRGLPVISESPRRYVLLSEIAKANATATVRQQPKGARNGTRIASTHPDARP